MVYLLAVMASPIRCLVSAGPTREYFDPVRFLSNPSSGRMGFSLASEAACRGWQVDLVSGPVSLPDPEGVRVQRVVTGAEMYEAVSSRFDACDILIMTAAIMDYRPRHVAGHKIKKFELQMSIEMEPVIDVLATVARRKNDQLIVGFAAETDHLDDYARRKLETKNADFIVANRIGGPDSAFERESNTVWVHSRHDPVRKIGPASKSAIARDLLDLFQSRLQAGSRPSSTD
jgi:phosphopantothenoylcysteine decarboxylase/phosphopantothenate--cysteine ligase